MAGAQSRNSDQVPQTSKTGSARRAGPHDLATGTESGSPTRSHFSGAEVLEGGGVAGLVSNGPLDVNGFQLPVHSMHTMHDVCSP